MAAILSEWLVPDMTGLYITLVAIGFLCGRAGGHRMRNQGVVGMTELSTPPDREVEWMSLRIATRHDDADKLPSARARGSRRVTSQR
jgi:hypothetical protein